MQIGEKRTVVIPPKEGFGEYDDDGVRHYPRMYIDNGVEVSAGDIVTWVNPASGREIPARVLAADERDVTLDLNHPFAGKTLQYELELISMVDD